MKPPLLAGRIDHKVGDLWHSVPMAAEKPMNNHVSPPAAASRAGKTHVLDLTSVCVSSGTVRLPLSLQGHFCEGDVTAHTADGELNLQFQAPRTLGGLSEFFAANDLRANDRVGFEFTAGQLKLTAIRRERRSSGGKAQQAAATTASHVVDADAQKVGGSGATDALDHEGPKPAGEASGPRTSVRGEDVQRSSVRAVKRVRIEGGEPPRNDLPAPRPIDRASSRDVWARRQYPAWRPLDRTEGDAPAANDEYDGAFSETTVRVIRRSDRTASANNQANTQASSLETNRKAETSGAQSNSKEAPSYAPEWPLVSRGRLNDTPRQAAPTAELDPYLDARLDVDREAERARHAAASKPPAATDSTGASGGYTGEEAAPATGATYGQQLMGEQWSEPGGWQEEAVQVAAAVHGAQHQLEPPRESQRERRGGLWERLGLKRSTGVRQAEARSGANAAYPESYGASRSDANSATQRTYTDQSVWPLSADDAATEVDVAGALLSGPELSEAAITAPAIPQSNALAGGPAAAATSTPTPRAAPLPAAKGPAAPNHSPKGSAAGGHLGDTLKADIQLLEQHLAQPETAAIVRCEELAKRLGIEYQRVSRAFQRMAEDRDRYTPLRGDAYMVRRNR